MTTRRSHSPAPDLPARVNRQIAAVPLQLGVRAGARPRRLGLEVGAFCGLLAFVGVVYAIVRPPIMNDETMLDPWIYFALFKNFGYLYHTFTWAYWTSRLPWIIPGIAVHGVLPPVAAYFVLHVTYFVAGGLLVYLIARRFYGVRVALVTASIFLLSPLVFDAHQNDYPDGPTITYLLAATYFGLSAIGAARRRLRVGIAGFFAAAAFGTQIYASVAILGIVGVYVAMAYTSRRFLAELGRDCIAGVVGAAVLLVACGSFAKAYGGEFLFFMPSWRYAQSIQLSRWQRPGHEWMLRESQLLIPVFVLALLLVLLARTRLRDIATDASVRFAAASCAFLLYMLVLLATWEAVFGGDFFEVYYYFSMFLVPVALALPAALFLSVRRAGRELSAATVAAGALLAALPLVLIERWGVAPINRAGFDVAAAVMAAAVALALVPRQRRAAWRAGTAAAIVAATSFATGYAGAAGYTTQTVFAPHAGAFTHRKQALSISLQLIDFMRVQHLQTNPPPAFWYDGIRYPPLNGIQSTYLWGITWIGREMPHLTKPDKRLLEARRPPNIILLCGNPRCAGGPSVLRRAGYRTDFRARALLQSHGEHYWAVAYALPKFKIVSPDILWYKNFTAPFVSAAAGTTIAQTTFARGLPSGWSSSGPLRRKGAMSELVTSSHPWAYELQGPTTTLPAGSYRVYVRGRVVRGGLDVGVLDAGANKWIQQRMYWSHQHGFAQGWMSTPFRLTEKTEVKLIFSNWTPKPASSVWDLGELRLARSG